MCFDPEVPMAAVYTQNKEPMLRLKHVHTYAALALIATVGLNSCSNKATEEQRKTLSQLDSQRDGLRSDLDRAQNNLRDAQGKLANADKDLADCNSDTQAASAWLVKWPNVWADSTDWRVAPPAPAPAAAPVETKKHRKH